MTDHQYAYPFDPTGESNDNLIVKESHIISPPDYNDFYFVVPAIGPFFEHNLIIQHWPTGRILVNGVDFVLSYKFLGASRATAKPVYGAISIYDREINGVLEVTYQTIGGPWTINEAKAAELLSNAMNNPRTTTWEQVIELPHSFPVIDHEWDLVDLVGASDVRDAIDRVTDTLLDTGGGGSGGSGDAHASNRDNPHQVTKAQVGLGSVENYTVASFSEGNDPSVTNRYMTPQRTAQLISSYLGNTVSAHIGSQENPHNVTQTQVGLSNVPNYRLANSTEAVDPLIDNRFVTPKRVHEAIQFVAISALDVHRLESDNPHDVTKSQVGLDRVENYAIASDAVARDGTSQIHYLTPHGATQMLEAKVGSGVVEHIDARDNPHMVTKGQIGLGNVPNYAMSDVTVAIAGTAQDRFMSPYHTKLLIDSLVADSNDALVDMVNGHTSDFDNPHRVTKAQVGLSTVQNYGMATSGEGIEGTRTDAYMSPKAAADLVTDRIDTAFAGFVAEDSSRLEGLTLSEVSSQIVGVLSPDLTQVIDDVTGLTQTVATNQQSFSDHEDDLDNPHRVTKAQLGLGSVPNFDVATQADAEEGSASNLFMTPSLVSAAIATQASQLVSVHASDQSNPHQVTKDQVGLGNVSDFTVAAQSEAETGTATDRYMTPQRVSQAIAFQAGQLVDTHANLVDNPHQVTKVQVGLGEVDNFSTASQTEAEDGSVNNRFMTPTLVSAAIAVQAAALVDAHESRTDNPHQVTQAQVGLGLVANYSVADSLTAMDPTNNASYMTPIVTHEVAQSVFDQGVVDTVDPQLQDIRNQMLGSGQEATDHIARTDNPHNVTKDQLGLGNVDNFATASELEALDESVTNRFMTPQRTHELLDSEVTSVLTTQQDTINVIQQIQNEFNARTDNPHQVTIEQIGGLPEGEIVTRLDEKLNVADGVAFDSNRFGGLTLEEYELTVNSRIENESSSLFDALSNRYLMPGNFSGGVVYRLVASAQFTAEQWADPSLLNDTSALSLIADVDAGNGKVSNQHVVVSLSPDNVWQITETSLMFEVESMFGLVKDSDNYRIEVWQKLPELSFDTSILIVSRNTHYSVLTAISEVLDEPTGMTYADTTSVRFSYRLAKAIEDEIGLVVQTLDA